MYILATDLDRTLFPNGKHKYDNSMKIFKEIIKEKNIELIYATGRRLKSVIHGIKKFKAPLPKYLITEIGTKVYYRIADKFIEDRNWIKEIKENTKKWNINLFKKKLSNIPILRLQEHYNQNDFKLSYYVDDLDSFSQKNTRREIEKIIKSICINATTIFSVNESKHYGYLDIMPECTTKLGALEYLRKKTNIKKKDFIYCGDSGNDLHPLIFGYKSILVRNATQRLKNIVRSKLHMHNLHKNVYFAEGYRNLNGYYVSGIIEGLIKHGIISSKFLTLS
ncbi:MAG: HAD-IIB family hydrolase [Candidatus Lokiarchaeota archaeon]|nr:HAD-IIB family hydrolase [Candidatus Lokiarchaeota archaeon]